MGFKNFLVTKDIQSGDEFFVAGVFLELLLELLNSILKFIWLVECVNFKLLMKLYSFVSNMFEIVARFLWHIGGNSFRHVLELLKWVDKSLLKVHFKLHELVF